VKLCSNEVSVEFLAEPVRVIIESVEGISIHTGEWILEDRRLKKQIASLLGIEEKKVGVLLHWELI
jgi:hypothetical protein